MLHRIILTWNNYNCLNSIEIFVTVINHMIDLHQRVAYIRLESFDAGNFDADYGSRIVASVGSRCSLLRNAKEFSSFDKCPHKVWELKYSNPHTSSFILSFSKKRTFGGDIQIGEAELKLSHFELNSVTKQEVKLRNFGNRRLSSTATISVHMCEDGSYPFSAREGHLLEHSHV